MPCPQTLPLLQPAQPRLCWSPPKSPAVSPVSRSPPTALTAPAWVPTEGSRSADASTATARDMRSAWIQQFQLISSPILQQFSEPVGCFRLCKRPSHARSHHFPSPLPGGARTGASLASPQLQHRCHRPPKPTAPPVPCPCPTQGCCWHWAQLLHRGCHPHEVPRTPLSPGRALQHRAGLGYGMSLIPPSIPAHLPNPRASGTPRGAAPLLPPPRADVLGQPVPAEPRGRVPRASRETWEPRRCQAGSRLEYQVLSCAAGCAASGAELGHPDSCGPPGPAHGRPRQHGELSAVPSPPGGRPARDLTGLLLCFPSPISAGPLCTICSRASIVPELK